jgi:hypothetical protein
LGEVQIKWLVSKLRKIFRGNEKNSAQCRLAAPKMTARRKIGFVCGNVEMAERNEVFGREEIESQTRHGSSLFIMWS